MNELKFVLQVVALKKQKEREETKEMEERERVYLHKQIGTTAANGDIFPLKEQRR